MKRISFYIVDYPKFITSLKGKCSNTTDGFAAAGFKTYSYIWNDLYLGPRHSLSEEEFTFFVLRYT